eukprot:TRINITY_DN467_c0_g3_i1.p1 TRINITY_DN467_c0_g3~~TRINITY_DN467_c0_g3_i1.p1  ORF type:complete len:148 (-),score=32.08 TRINITY_DN467_c0_g3_i1:111-554(-)
MKFQEDEAVQKRKERRKKGEELSVACERGELQKVEQLVSEGADVNWKGSHAITPLHHAASNGRRSVAEFLISKGAEVEPIDGGCTPLHNAAYYGHQSVVEFLVSNGASIHAKNNKGTPVFHSIIRCQLPGVEFLISHGAHVDVKVLG